MLIFIKLIDIEVVNTIGIIIVRRNISFYPGNSYARVYMKFLSIQNHSHYPFIQTSSCRCDRQLPTDGLSSKAVNFITIVLKSISERKLFSKSMSIIISFFFI